MEIWIQEETFDLPDEVVQTGEYAVMARSQVGNERVTAVLDCHLDFQTAKRVLTFAKKVGLRLDILQFNVVHRDSGD